MTTSAPAVKNTETKILELYRSAMEKGEFNRDLLTLNEAGIERFEALGFPHRKHEMFTYVDTSKLVSGDLKLVDKNPAEYYTTLIRGHIFPNCGRSVITVVDGVYSEALSDISGLDGMVKITPLDKAVADPDVMQYLIEAVRNEDDPFAALNIAFVRQGVMIEIEPFMNLRSPLQILFLSTGSASGAVMTTPLVLVRAWEGSEVEVVTKHAGAGEHSFFNAVQYFNVDKSASIRYIQNGDSSGEATSFTKNRVTIKGDGKFYATDVSAGTKLRRSHYEARLKESGAQFQLNLGSVLTGSNQSHIYARVHHEAPDCVSGQLFKNVVAEKGRSSVDTTVIVHGGAQNTESVQKISNLLLTDKGHADVKPNLMIYADDVKCSHGATSGKLNESQLLYLRSRGVNERDARMALIRGFVMPVLKEIEHSSLADELRRGVLSRLEASHVTAG